MANTKPKAEAEKKAKAEARAKAKAEAMKKETVTLKKEGAEIVAEITKLKEAGKHRMPGMQKRLNEISSRLRVIGASTNIKVKI